MTTRFGAFVHCPEKRLLSRGGRERRLTPKAFDLLTALIDAHPDAVSKAALQQTLWPDTFVVEANLSNLVAEVRDALGERPGRGVIRTIHGYGYAFAGEARPAGRRGAAARPVAWLEWGERRFPLSPGEHVIGRDPSVEVHLDAASVSRRHARIVVRTDGSVQLEDFSKNGTFRGRTRLTSPTALVDGDELRIGRLLLTYHVSRAQASTETFRGGAP